MGVTGMKNIVIEGTQEVVIEKLLVLMNLESAQRFIEMFRDAKNYIGEDEVLEQEVKIPHLPNNEFGFMFFRTEYTVNIKPTTLVLLAFVYDLSINKDMISSATTLTGFSYQVLKKLNTYSGEKCMVIEAMKSKGYAISFDSVLNHKKTCGHLSLKCKYCVGNICTIRRNDLMDLMSNLCGKNVFKMSDVEYKLNW